MTWFDRAYNRRHIALLWEWKVVSAGHLENVSRNGEECERYVWLTQYLSIARVRSHGVDNREGKLSFGEVFRETFIDSILHQRQFRDPWWQSILA